MSDEHMTDTSRHHRVDIHAIAPVRDTIDLDVIDGPYIHTS